VLDWVTNSAVFTYCPITYPRVVFEPFPPAGLSNWRLSLSTLGICSPAPFSRYLSYRFRRNPKPHGSKVTRALLSVAYVAGRTKRFVPACTTSLGTRRARCGHACKTELYILNSERLANFTGLEPHAILLESGTSAEHIETLTRDSS